MEKSLQVFSYGESPVRTVIIDGEVWFVAKDVCDVLDLTNPTVAVEALDEDERSKYYLGRSPIHGGGEANVISESGLYSLVFRSNKPEAKNFSRWVRHEVLPTLRKTGSYTLLQKPSLAEFDPMQAAKLILDAANIKGNQLALALDKVAAHYTGYSLLALSGVALIAPTTHQLLTPTQIGKHFNMSGRRVNELLIREGYQQKTENGYEPLVPGLEFAVMLDTNKKHSDGTPVRQLKWDSSIIPELTYSLNESKE